MDGSNLIKNLQQEAKINCVLISLLIFLANSYDAT